MTLARLVGIAADKSRFITIQDYLDFAARFSEFLVDGVQANIVSQNENHYRFLQYREDGHYNISRPINSNLMYGIDDVAEVPHQFLPTSLVRSQRDFPARTLQGVHRQAHTTGWRVLL